MRARILIAAVFCGLSLLGLAQNFPRESGPRYFGIEDGTMPSDPRLWQGGRFYDFPTWEVNPETPNDVFTFARLRYNSGTWMGRRQKWMIDYPDSELNFSYRLQEMTSLEVDPRGAIVDIDPEQLRHYPFIYMIEPGDIWITDEEAGILRDYLLNGGFIMVDDFWGFSEWKAFERALRQIFPDREYVELELDHPIFHMVFDLEIKPQIPAVGLAMEGRQRGITYEWNKPGSETPHYRAILDDDGHICMMICFNTDLGDGWEEEGTDPWYFTEFSEKYAYPLGINIVFYALTH
ncbi:MAG: DUF4159 domain-containing protein [Verrucomicrobiota bacterium]